MHLDWVKSAILVTAILIALARDGFVPGLS